MNAEEKLEWDFKKKKKEIQPNLLSQSAVHKSSHFPRFFLLISLHLFELRLLEHISSAIQSILIRDA